MDRRSERRLDADAAAGNRAIARRELALEILRQDSSLTMLVAVERADAILRAKGGR